MLTPTGLPILSEEGAHAVFEKRVEWPAYWLVDPLDGTKEFIKRNGEFTVNIALMQDNKPVAGVIYAPVPDILYYGSKETNVYKEAEGITEHLLPLSEKVSLEALLQQEKVIVVASRSHLSTETEAFIKQFKNVQLVNMGSSFKLMLLAENKADIYPRFAPTMEWDTAAGHAILNAVNRSVYQTDLTSELIYNKQDLLNPSFVAF
ncbi:3'(2'),5'-bisphosphate nucleotidase CysQ family protein [Pontibacter rugosus]